MAGGSQITLAVLAPILIYLEIVRLEVRFVWCVVLLIPDVPICLR